MLYEFRCEITKKEFEVYFPTIDGYKKALEEGTILCPCCGKNKVIKIFSACGLAGLPTRGSR